MRLVAVESLTVNEKVGVPIRSQDGSILLSANVTITEKYIRHLKNLGIKALYVEDDFFTDAVINPAIKPETKISAINVMTQLFRSIEKGKDIDTTSLTKCVKSILDDIGARILEPISILDMFAVNDKRCHHAVNVAILVAAMSKFYTYEEAINSKVVEDYVLAALLHDAFLDDMATDNEDISHPEKIFSYLKENRFSSTRTYMTCYMHHECYDGSGFPQKKSGNDIYIGAKLLAVADLYDNLINGYGKYKPMKEHEAYEYINSRAGTVIDPAMLSCFNKSVAIYPVGATVRLNIGQTAIVTEQTVLPSRPKVRLSMPKKEECLLINLLSNRTIFIENIVI